MFFVLLRSLVSAIYITWYGRGFLLFFVLLRSRESAVYILPGMVGIAR